MQIGNYDGNFHGSTFEIDLFSQSQQMRKRKGKTKTFQCLSCV